MQHKKILIPVLGIALLSSALFGVTFVQAADTTPTTPSIVQKIAEKFNLKTDEVQKVFDEEHETRHKAMQEKMQEGLSQAVKDGKITSVQKDAIVKKFQSLDMGFKNHESFKEMTQEERRSAMQTKKAELESWAKENNLTLETLHEVLGGKGEFGFHGKFGRGMMK
ncbi:MAG: hypothetical protein RLZZ455_102 [Candidatus Parcubacteria bacterium]|jgi:hypothetical protein